MVVFSWPLEQVAKGVTDGRRLEQAGRELVQQRLEGVVVVPVDEHDLGVGLPQLLGGADPGEPPAEDEDARALAHVVPPSRSSRWSPTRSALAMMVRVGFTAPIETKKLAFTT